MADRELTRDRWRAAVSRRLEPEWLGRSQDAARCTCVLVATSSSTDPSVSEPQDHANIVHRIRPRGGASASRSRRATVQSLRFAGIAHPSTEALRRRPAPGSTPDHLAAASIWPRCIHRNSRVQERHREDGMPCGRTSSRTRHRLARCLGPAVSALNGGRRRENRTGRGPALSRKGGLRTGMTARSHDTFSLQRLVFAWRDSRPVNSTASGVAGPHRVSRETCIRKSRNRLELALGPVLCHG